MAEGGIPPIKFPQTTVECEGCGAEFDVTWFCKNCSASLCKTCKEEHAREKFLKKHEVVPRTGSVLWTHGSWKLKESCLKHDRELVTFCNDCNQPCCINCIQEHPRHSFVTLENIYFEAETRLNSYVNDLIKVLLPTIQNDMSVLKQKIDSCTDNFEKAKSEVDSFFDSMKKVLEQSRAEMKSKLTKTQEQCRIALSEVLTFTETDMKAVQSIISVVERRIRAGGLDLITYYPKCPQISSHSDMFTPIPHFVPNDKIVVQLKREMGKIDYNQNRGNPMHNSFEQIEERFKIKTSNFRADIYGRSIEPVSKHAAWVSDHSSEVVYLYDSQGKKLRSEVIRGSRGILDIAVRNNGDIIVSREDLKVSLLSVKGVLTTLIDTAPFVPTGICLNNKGKIVVGMSDQGGKNHVAVYTRDGKSKLRKITGRLKHNTHLFTFPYRVTVIENQIITLNHWENIVSVNENSGKLNWQYDGGLARRDKEFGPVGLCSDRFSHVFVTDDNNHCIHIIDGKGSLLKIIYTIMKNGIYLRPWGIGVDNQNEKIWFGNVNCKQLGIFPHRHVKLEPEREFEETASRFLNYTQGNPSSTRGLFSRHRRGHYI